jgi:putative MATE family efflux protein
MSQAETGDITDAAVPVAAVTPPPPAAVLAHGRAGREERPLALLKYMTWLALPVIGEQVLSMTVGLTDVWLAGHLGPAGADATAAVGAMSYFLWLIGLITGAISAGSMAVIARAIGARHRSVANSVCGQSVTAAVVLGAVLAAVMYAFAEPIARLTGLPESAQPMALTYLRVLAFSLPFSTLIFAGNACLRGAGDMLMPAAVMITVDLVNAAVSVSLTRGLFGLPELGFKGIAIGTLIAYIVGGLLLLAVLLSGRGKLRLYPHRMRPHWATLKRVLRIGLPSGLEGTLTWAAQFVVLRIINQGAEGSVSGAAHAVTIRVESFSFLLGYAIATATATVVGQSLGARDPRRATRAAWLAFLAGGGIMTACGVAFVLWPRALTSLLTSDPRVADLAARCLVPAGFAQVGFAAGMIFGGALRGAGDTFTVMCITIGSTLSLRLVGVLIVGAWLRMGVAAIWVVLSIELMIRGAIMTAVFLRGRWKHVDV